MTIPIGRSPPGKCQNSGPPGTRPSLPSASRPAGRPGHARRRLWLLRDAYTTETAWAPRHVGKELRLSRLRAFHAGLGAIRADAETAAAAKQMTRPRRPA
jgi:hypothetical protein